MADIKSWRGLVKSFEYVAPDVQIASFFLESVMSEAKFTPGPWKFDGEESVHYDLPTLNIRDEYGAIVVCASDHYEGDNEANAHLIAAAPELYEALQACLNFMENTESDLGFSLESADQARTALAKARGEV